MINNLLFGLGQNLNPISVAPVLGALFVFFVNSFFSWVWMDWGTNLISTGFFSFGFSMGELSSNFLIFCTFISLMVLYFSSFYMLNLESKLFGILIYFFVSFMVFLTWSSNCLTMFIGWEGVGVMSFFLISWFGARGEALGGGKSAVLFNRFTDFFFVVLVFFELGGGSGLFLKSESNFLPLGSESNFLPLFFASAFMLSTMGKSAQLLFHPWLTLAMEGPTPVSSLLHSSTMVVAGVFLSITLFPFLFLSEHYASLSLLKYSSFVTMIFTSIWALNSQDLKKTIALSTTSQLSFMFFLVSLGFPEMAFIHLLIHGFFKALLFMGSGVLIHSRESATQNWNKLKLNKSNFFFMYLFLVGGMGLMGYPLVGGFFSKHMFLGGLGESSIVCHSFSMVWGSIFSFILTISYGLKTLLAPWGLESSTSLKFSGSKIFSLSPESSGEVLPLLSLSFLTICLGEWIVSFSMEGLHNPLISEEVGGVSKFLFFLGGIILFLSFPHFVFVTSSCYSIFFLEASLAPLKNWVKSLGVTSLFSFNKNWVKSLVTSPNVGESAILRTFSPHKKSFFFTKAGFFGGGCFLLMLFFF